MSITLYGIHPVTEALRTRPQDVHRVILARRHNDPALQDIRALCEQHHIRIDHEDHHTIDRRVGAVHQGVLAEVAPFPLTYLDDVIQTSRRTHEKLFLLVLDAVQDPHNMGALIRSAVCCGAQAVIFPKDRSAPLSPAVAKASAGAIEHIRLCRVVNIAGTLKDLKQHGVWVVGTSPQADQTIYSFDFDRDVALVVGGEGKGMRQLVAKTCDALVAIPLHGNCASLNAAAAGAVVMYEVLRQRQYENVSRKT